MSVDTIRQRLANATPGPWVFASDAGPPTFVQLYSAAEDVDEYDADILSADGSEVLICAENADLIANAPADLSILLDVADAARTYLAAVLDMGGEMCWDQAPGEPYCGECSLCALRDALARIEQR